MARRSIGRLEALPTDRCVAVADDRAVAVRVDGGVCVFANRCPHAGQPVAGGWVTGGVLICPAHFWRFDTATGRLGGIAPGLDPLETEIVDGEVFVELPAPEPEQPLRQRLLDHARTWHRDDPPATV
ncbi:MAG: Rieske (2Fe-2S) protein [Acidimicrobiia bacterium]|nr:Rieske (2Fe-2S) protein [Acidimicrobiia bacterium]